MREGKNLWVIRKDGEYLDDDIEYTTDEVIPFERGLSLVAKKEFAAR